MFSNDFKDKAFKVAWVAGVAGEVVKAIESENITKLRYILEDLMEDPKLYIDGNTGFNRQVNPSFKNTYINRRALYSEFMQILNKKLDSGKILSKHGVRI